MNRPALRAAAERETPLVTPLAHDALSARLIERAGFRAFAIGGSAMLAARHAFPDIGLVGLAVPARDLGSMIRGYIKWDDVPGSVPAALEAILRARIIATTPPQGPVYVCLDASLQERLIAGAVEPPPVGRFAVAEPADPPSETLARAAAVLSKASRPVILMGRVSTDPADWDRRVALAERLDARVFTDMKNGACFPTTHPLHGCPPGLFLSADAWPAIGEADVILSLDWIDLAGTLRQTSDGGLPKATVIQCSVDQYCHNGWSMDHALRVAIATDQPAGGGRDRHAP